MCIPRKFMSAVYSRFNLLKLTWGFIRNCNYSQHGNGFSLCYLWYSIILCESILHIYYLYSQSLCRLHCLTITWINWVNCLCSYIPKQRRDSQGIWDWICTWNTGWMSVCHLEYHNFGLFPWCPCSFLCSLLLLLLYIFQFAKQVSIFNDILCKTSFISVV